MDIDDLNYDFLCKADLLNVIIKELYWIDELKQYIDQLFTIRIEKTKVCSVCKDSVESNKIELKLFTLKQAEG